MKFKGTKGPWHASVPNKNFGPKVWGADDRLVADCGNIRQRTEEEEAANAQLIACALEMLEMLKKAAQTINSLKLSMMAHPDHEVGSEFDDMTDKAERTHIEIMQVMMKATTI